MVIASFYFTHDMAYSFEKNLAINTNYHHLVKSCKNNGISMSDTELIAAAKWNYKTFGFGKTSLNDYLVHKNRFKYKRLYNLNVKEWYKLLAIIFKRDNYTCSYCGDIGGKLEGDHIVPISKGGSNDLENLTTSCRRCNRQKKDKTVIEFITWKNNR